MRDNRTNTLPKGVFRSTCSIPADLLNDGVYRVSVMFVEDTSVVISGQNDLLEFEVHDDHSERGKWYGKWVGVTRPKLCWRTELIRINEPRDPFPAIAFNPY